MPIKKRPTKIIQNIKKTEEGFRVTTRTYKDIPMRLLKAHSIKKRKIRK